MRRSEPSVKTLRNKADRLAAAYCKRAGSCAASGHVGRLGAISCSGRIEWAHLKSRGHLSIRHDPRNAMPLCHAHHRWFTLNPDEWVAFAERRDPGVWDYLNHSLNSRPRKPLREVFESWIRFYESEEENL